MRTLLLTLASASLVMQEEMPGAENCLGREDVTGVRNEQNSALVERGLPLRISSTVDRFKMNEFENAAAMFKKTAEALPTLDLRIRAEQTREAGQMILNYPKHRTSAIAVIKQYSIAPVHLFGMRAKTLFASLQSLILAFVQVEGATNSGYEYKGHKDTAQKLAAMMYDTFRNPSVIDVLRDLFQGKSNAALQTVEVIEHVLITVFLDEETMNTEEAQQFRQELADAGVANRAAFLLLDFLRVDLEKLHVTKHHLAGAIPLLVNLNEDPTLVTKKPLDAIGKTVDKLKTTLADSPPSWIPQVFMKAKQDVLQGPRGRMSAADI